MRLDKFIANNTAFSRSDVGRLIKEKRVLINGDHATRKECHIDAVADSITIDGGAISNAGHLYFMLHKPAGYVCANSDATHPTVIDLIDTATMPTPMKNALQLVGRLDIDTTGLILLTTDGDWNHSITSPRHCCKKTYQVTLQDPFNHDSIALFEKGIQLKGEKNLTRPATMHIIDSYRVVLTISEGKYHQVKRMFAATGNHVTQLHRIKIGGIELDSQLLAGEYRALHHAEVIC